MLDVLSSSNGSNDQQVTHIIAFSVDNLERAKEENERVVREITPEQHSRFRKIAKTVGSKPAFSVIDTAVNSLNGISKLAAGAQPIIRPIQSLTGKRAPWLVIPIGVFGICRGGIEHFEKLASCSRFFQSVPIDEAKKILHTIYDGAEDLGMIYSFLQSLTDFIVDNVLAQVKLMISWNIPN